MPRTIVVLPTPGPPVTTATLPDSASATASACWRASVMPACCSYQASARGTSISTEAARPVEQLAQPLGDGALGAVEVGVVDGGARVERARVDLRVERDVARAREAVDGGVGELLGDLEQRRRLAHEALARHEDVAVRRRTPG